MFYRTHVAAAFQTGLRWGELTGRPVENVDLLRGEIRVDQQFLEVNGHHELTPRLNTATSRRTVTIGRKLAELWMNRLGGFRMNLVLCPPQPRVRC